MALNALLLKLEKSGDLLSLFKAGFISYKILEHKDIYLTYDVYRKQGKSHPKAIQTTADQFEMSDMSVYRIVKSMQDVA